MVSNKPTHDVSCVSKVCSPTAQNANLNVSELTNMLASSDTTLKSGNGAIDIQMRDRFSWKSANRLGLDAAHSIEFYEPITVAGKGALTISYNERGSGGDLYFFERGRVYFRNQKSNLVINFVTYSLVGDIATLATNIEENPTGAFALVADYDAFADGGYSRCPIDRFSGILEGLGHHIQNLTVKGYGGFFCDLAGAVVRDLALANVDIRGSDDVRGALADVAARVYKGADTSIVAVSVSGRVAGEETIGGLVGRLLHGEIVRSHSDATVISKGNGAGGLVGLFSGGLVDQSYSTGAVAAGGAAGGLVGTTGKMRQLISNSFATGTVKGTLAGGLVGALGHGRPKKSYSAASIQGSGGGVIGSNEGRMRQIYWDLNTSGKANGCGSGDCSGATGLTDVQLKAGLPQGFDPKIWGSDPNINNGYPYLRANPPQ
ncbi:MAG: hypothetical protein JO056_08330 [Alphaproteobacteria bacterium]|nr:hypothetical protein [Alphaproteobacteria bacterium]